MIRIIVLLLPVIFQSCIFSSGQNQELEQFEELLGGYKNKRLLDSFISQMEDKIVKTYKAKTLTGNYNLYLEDILKKRTSRIMNYDSLDCQLLYGFENSKLANQYQFQKYDSVYFDRGIVTIDKNGEEKVEIVYNDSLQITERIEYLRKIGYTELKEIGKLQGALQSEELRNKEVQEYYLNRDRSCLPMFEDYIRTIYLQKPDYENYIVKSNLLYEIYLTDIAYNTNCG